MSTVLPDRRDEAGGAQPSAVRAEQQIGVTSITITQRTLWTALAIVVGAVAAFVIISQALGPLILLLLAIILGEAIRPVVLRLEHYRIPPPVAVLMIFVLGLALAVLLLWFLLSPVVTELTSLSNHLPEYQRDLQSEVTQLQQRLKAQGGLGQAVQNLAAALATAVQHSAPALIAIPFNFLKGIFGIVIDLVIILTMTLFWLMSSRTLKQFVVGLFPASTQAHTSAVIEEVSRTFGGYVRGTLISMILIGLISGLGLALLGVPYALLLGVLAGLTELLPYLGPWISGSVSVLLALIAVGPLKAVEVVILFILIQELEGNVVQPMVMSRSVHIDPLLVIVAVLIGINLLGIIGAVLAVPVAAGVQVLVVRVLAPFIRQRAASVSSPPPPLLAEDHGGGGAYRAGAPPPGTSLSQPPDASENSLAAPA
jgi:predicted PurR-regulated permease PerM